MCMGHVDKALLLLAKEMALKLRKDFEEFKDEEFPKVKNLLNEVEAKLHKELQALHQKVEEQGRDLTETRQEVAETKGKVESVAQELKKVREVNERKQQQHEKDLSETADKVKELEQTSKENMSEMTDKAQDLQQEFGEHKQDLAGAQAQLKELTLTSVETNTRVEYLTQEQKKLAEDTKEKFEQLKSSKRNLECLEEKVAHVSQECKRMKLEDEKVQHPEYKVDDTRDSLLETNGKVEQLEQRHKRKVQGNIRKKKRRRKQGKRTSGVSDKVVFSNFNMQDKIMCVYRYRF